MKASWIKTCVDAMKAAWIKTCVDAMKAACTGCLIDQTNLDTAGEARAEAFGRSPRGAH